MRSIVQAEWRRSLILAARYPMETLSSILTMFLVFAGLFYGASYITDSPIGAGRLATIVVGYAVWMTMMSATGDMGWSVQNEAQNGTLEQVMMVPRGAVWVFLVRALMAIVVFLIPLVMVVCAMIALTGVGFVWRLEALEPFLMTLITAWGLGLLVAGIALIFKRIGQVLNIVQFLLLFVIMIPLGHDPGWLWHILAVLLPFTAQVALLRHVLQTTAPVPPSLWLSAGFNMIIWMLTGVMGFIGAERFVRRRGTLGHY
ncbi:hypothetical protein BXT84_12430 [Sulfobacillus thermotolerans]|uniref:ABC-2 type transporter domain-containing protein n=1 Tax=Sulfobacillus thermotolerans TaxID=338644 RepID=A0ABN5H2I3_9FIRM|nr:hypothetical protein BXT84_12430 [Sulfobacillus thermotolerans]